MDDERRIRPQSIETMRLTAYSPDYAHGRNGAVPPSKEGRDHAQRRTARENRAGHSQDREHPGYDPQHWQKIYAAQEQARNNLKAINARAEGDRSRFQALDLNTVDDPPPLELGAERAYPASGVIYLYGKPNVGKTPHLAWTALERVRAGWDKGVCIGVYELEMGKNRWKRLLQELGATPAEIKRIHYYSDMANPEDLIVQGRALCSKALEDGCTGLIYDSMVAMLAVSGIEENNPVGIRNWVNSAARPFALQGGAVWIIDHTGLADQDRPRNSSDKMAGCDFAVSMRVVAGKAGKRGVSGEYALKCFKDRSAQLIGESMKVRHHAQADGSFTYESEGWQTVLDEAVLLDEGVHPVASGQGTQQKIWGILTKPMTPRGIALILAISEGSVSMALKRGMGKRFSPTGDGHWVRVED